VSDAKAGSGNGNEPENDVKPEDDRTMSFWEHLDELRRRLTRAAITYIIATFAAWTIRDKLLQQLWKPFREEWIAQKIPGDPSLHFAAPGDQFAAYFKLSMIAALGLSAPIIFWELWSFVAPGLYKKEKRWSFAIVFVSTLFFVGGGLFGWRIAFPISFSYFLGLTGEAAASGVNVVPTVMMGDYLDFTLQMLLAFGIVFELPLFLTVLSMLGIINYLTMIRFGRWFVLIASVIGAVISPPDTTSMIVMTVPLVGLYFLSIGLAYIFGQKPSDEQIERDRLWREEKKLEEQARKAIKKREQEAEKKARQAEKEAEKAQKKQG
jgi:sec-independent protein translocase protein TatC